MREFMNYDDWLKSAPKEITSDLLWKVEAYRLALLLLKNVPLPALTHHESRITPPDHHHAP